ncbi:MAG: hypothetical protein PWP56_2625 [Acetobacterium sp.]|jgi:uncharacterized protein YrzB (UPF0473 family)|nr:hypothetical protein [Acetobacterium sp.]
MPQQTAEHLTYTDFDGNAFEMTIVKHFEFSKKDYVLAKERQAPHEHGPNCSCYEHDHQHSDEDEIYVFELLNENQNKRLVAVSDEVILAMSPILETL